MNENKILSQFIKSVTDLADGLPQWSSMDDERLKQSIISSLFEEAGEISGLISKYRTRKHYWETEPKFLSKDEFNLIKEKFMDETGDLLWVIVCSVNVLYFLSNSIYDGSNENVNIDIIDKEVLHCPIFDVSFEQSLFDVIRDISLLRQSLVFSVKVNKNDVINLLNSFGVYLVKLEEEYGITFDEICTYNMNKLGKRYTIEGEKVDGN